MNTMDMMIFKVPIIHLLFSSIFGEDVVLWVKILNIGNLIFFITEFIGFAFLGFEFDYFTFNILMPRSLTPKFIDFIFPLTLGFMYWYLMDMGYLFGIFINLVATLYALIKIMNIFYEFHFVKGKTIYYCIISFEIVYLLESVNSLFTSIWKNFNNEIDADLLFIVLFLLLVNVYRILHERKRKWLQNLKVYNINNARVGDQYLENLKLLLDRKKNRETLLELYTLLTKHLKGCKETTCICRLTIFKFGKLNGRTVEQEINRVGTASAAFKLILFNDSKTIEEIIHDHNKSFDNEECFNMTVNINNKNIDQLLSNFYYKLVKKIKKNIFGLFISFMFYSIHQVDNCLGSLIMSYQYLHSYEFKQERNFYKIFILKNITSLSSDILHSRFKESEHELAKEQFYQVYAYKSTINEIEKQITKAIAAKYEFYQEFSEKKINFKTLISLGNTIIETQNKIEEMFKDLFEKNMNNSKLLHLYIKYKKQLHFEKDFELREFFDRYYYMKRMEITEVSISTQIKKKGTVNLFNHTNMILFVKIKDHEFHIEKYSTNFLEYFGYTKEEIKNFNVKKIMPKQISRHHDTYIKNFLNRKRGTRINIRHFSSFGQTKSKELKVVGLVIKLEFLLLDDIYLTALMNFEQKNNKSLLLTEFNGNVVSMNQSGEEIMGKRIYNTTYSLFLSVPILLKYYFPQVSNHVVHRRIAGKRKAGKISKTFNKQNTFIQSDKDVFIENKLGKRATKVRDNLEVEVLRMRCFLFHILDISDFELQKFGEVSLDEVGSMDGNSINLRERMMRSVGFREKIQACNFIFSLILIF